MTPNGTWCARRRGTVYYTGNSGWQIEASNVRHQVLPTCGIVAGCLTKAFLRPALIAAGYSAEQVRRVAVWYDPTNLVESPDRAQDARDAWDRDAISNEALREALGFNEDDEPEAHEHLVRLLSRGRLTPQAVPLVAALSGVDLRDPAIQQAMAISVGLNPPRTVPGRVESQRPELPPGQRSTANPAAPGQVVPEQAAPAAPGSSGGTPAGVTAAGQRTGPCDDASRELAAIDALLTERITVAADAAIARAVERAEGRIRNAIRKDKALTASIDGAEPGSVAATLGRGTVASFVSMPELLAGAYQRLEDQFTRWLTLAGQEAANVTLRRLGADIGSIAARDLQSALTEQLATRRAAAWSALTAAMDGAAELALFQCGATAPDSLISPADVRSTLIVAGGGKPGRHGNTGFATGPIVRGAIERKPHE